MKNKNKFFVLGLILIVIGILIMAYSFLVMAAYSSGAGYESNYAQWKRAEEYPSAQWTWVTPFSIGFSLFGIGLLLAYYTKGIKIDERYMEKKVMKTIGKNRCPNCGAIVNEDYIFCPNCNYPLKPGKGGGRNV